MTVKTEAVECWKIEDAPGLDWIQAIWMQTEPGKGYVTLICYGQAWTAYFGAMSGMGIREFFADCDTDYMVTKMGITPHLRATNRDHAYLGKIIDAVKAAIKQRATA